MSDFLHRKELKCDQPNSAAGFWILGAGKLAQNDGYLFALHTANPHLIPHTTYSLLNTTRLIPKQSQVYVSEHNLDLAPKPSLKSQFLYHMNN